MPVLCHCEEASNTQKKSVYPCSLHYMLQHGSQNGQDGSEERTEGWHQLLWFAKNVSKAVSSSTHSPLLWTILWLILWTNFSMIKFVWVMQYRQHSLSIPSILYQKCVCTRTYNKSGIDTLRWQPLSCAQLLRMPNWRSSKILVCTTKLLHLKRAPHIVASKLQACKMMEHNGCKSLANVCM